MLDSKALAEATALIVKEHVSAIVGPLLKRIEELEAKPIPQPEVGKDDLTAIVADVESLRKAVSEWKEPDPVIIPDVQALVDEAFSKVHIPDAVDIRAIGKMVDDAVAAIPPAQPGKDADPEEMRREIAEQVKAAVAAIPVPKNGDSVTVDDVRPLIEEHVAKAVAAIPVPKDGNDGIGMAGGFIDAAGELVLTRSNGELSRSGRVVGKDGKDVDMDEVKRLIKELFDAWPKPRDALAVEDMDEELRDGGRIIVHRYRRGNECFEFEHKTCVAIYRGLWKEGHTYDPGDMVTWGGHMWHCDKETTAKPDGPEHHWTMAVRKPRDGSSPKPVKV